MNKEYVSVEKSRSLKIEKLMIELRQRGFIIDFARYAPLSKKYGEKS